jgi:hypothetical protein
MHHRKPDRPGQTNRFRHPRFRRPRLIGAGYLPALSFPRQDHGRSRRATRDTKRRAGALTV